MAGHGDAHVAGPGCGFYIQDEAIARMGEMLGIGNCGREAMTEMTVLGFLSSGL